MSVDLKQALSFPLRELKDIFVWTNNEIPRIDLQFSHTSRNQAIKQASSNARAKLEVQTKQEILKLSDVGITKHIQHRTWLANIVPVKKEWAELLMRRLPPPEQSIPER